MEILFVLLVLVALTRLFGEIAVRLGQPALVGELICGIVLGVVVHEYASAFPVLAGLPENEVFTAITDLGVFFLMLLAGLEMHPRSFTKGSGGSLLIAVCGLLVPLALGAALGWYYLPASSYRIAQTMFLGTALAVTAVPVAVKILMDIGQLETPVGKTIVGAAVFDDVLSLLLLAVLTGLIQTGEAPDTAALLLIVVKILAFFAIATGIGLYVLPFLEPLVSRLWSEEFEFSALLIVGLGFAVLAEVLEMHFIIGAFLAGLFFTRRTITPEIYDEVKTKVAGLTKGFLAPVFFASVGLHLDLGAFQHVPVFVALLIAAAIVGKLIGAGVPAMLTGMSARDSLTIGVGMSARGAVELIIADIALRAGLFSQPEPTPPIVAQLFSATVIMAVVTTLFTPIGLRWLIRRPRGSD